MVLQEVQEFLEQDPRQVNLDYQEILEALDYPVCPETQVNLLLHLV